MRRATYDLGQAEARAHLLEGFEIALDNLDEVIAIIRASETTADARGRLMERFALSERQTNAILEMRLRALTALERQRVLDELEEMRAKIADLKDLLASDARIRITSYNVCYTKLLRVRCGDSCRISSLAAGMSSDCPRSGTRCCDCIRRPVS